MSIRVTAVIDCQLDLDANQVRTHLDWSLNAAFDVQAYWRDADWHQPKFKDVERNWRLAHSPAFSDRLIFHGPGLLSVWAFPGHVEIQTGCRWRGFLTIRDLRALHLRAFNRIASTLGAKELILMPNDARVQDLLWSGGSFADAIAALDAEFGPPQSSAAQWTRKSQEGGRTRTWFYEDVLASI